MEDSLVIYRLARAPERRIFYIDVGNLPPAKAETHMKDIMARYRNKVVYDSTTGQLKDDRKHMSMLEDFWLPRKEGGRGTEISTLPGGENLGQIDDIVYFQKRLYRSLNVPINRLEQEAQYLVALPKYLGRVKFVDHPYVAFRWSVLRHPEKIFWKVSQVDWAIGRMTLGWLLRDNCFTELNAELLKERLNTMDRIPTTSVNFSREWVMKNIMFSDEDIEKMR